MFICVLLSGIIVKTCQVDVSCKRFKDVWVEERRGGKQLSALPYPRQGFTLWVVLCLRLLKLL